MYSLTIEGILKVKLRRLAKLARQQQAGEDAVLSPAFEYLLQDVQVALRTDVHYHLSQDLQVALYRWVKRDPFMITKAARFQIHCAHTPAAFADFLEQELIDDEGREHHIRKARSAGGWGYRPYGLTYDEMRAAENRCYEADNVD